MQFERFYSLNHGIVAWFAHLHHLEFQPIFTNLVILCGGTGVSVQPYAHPQQLILLNALYMYDVGLGCNLKGSTASTMT